MDLTRAHQPHPSDNSAATATGLADETVVRTLDRVVSLRAFDRSATLLVGRTSSRNALQARLNHLRSPPPSSDIGLYGKAFRKQSRRSVFDFYTPTFVRGFGASREGWCGLCAGEGKWLNMKDSSYWYHRQFKHGISSSGCHFLPPVEARPSSSGQLHLSEGLCHACNSWQSSECVKPNGEADATTWFRHAASCHTYSSEQKIAAVKAITVVIPSSLALRSRL